MLIEEIKALASNTSTKNIELIRGMGRMLLKNKNSPYENNDGGKENFFNDLYLKIDEANLIPTSAPSGTKNLLYFTLFLNDTYLDMVEMLLDGVLKHTPNINFDILFITDEIFAEKIKQRIFYDKFNIHFLIKESPISGVRASMEKMNIHDFQFISDYNKILFLDCDILCLRDLNILFDVELGDGLFYSAVPVDVSFEKIYTITHGLMYLTTRDATFIQQNPEKILAINAGQFLFLNTERMKKHFENVKWMMKNWPALYFFEQSFVNQYFVFNGLSSKLKIGDAELINFSRLKKILVEKPVEKPVKKLLKSLIVYGAMNSIYSFKEPVPESFTLEMVHNSHGVISHFAGSATNGNTKIKYIREYKDAYKL